MRLERKYETLQCESIKLAFSSHSVINFVKALDTAELQKTTFCSRGNEDAGYILSCLLC